MATPDPKNEQRAAAPPTSSPPILASAISAATLTIVQSLESLPEVAQRRIIEGVRVALGLNNQPLPAPRQQAPSNNSNQRRQNGQ